MISQRVRTTQNPPLVALGQLANKQSDCISLGQGAPYYYPDQKLFVDLPTVLATDHFHRYTADAGLLSLRKAISDKLHSDQQITATPDQIVLTPGANQAFYNVLVTLTDPGDEILLLTPYYFNHYMACTMLNLIPRTVALRDDFGLDLAKIAQTITAKTKAIVLVNPGNPTGVVHNSDELSALVELAEQRNIVIIADETYEYFVYEGKHIPTATLGDGVISISSFSKTFGVPGWRLGYYVADPDFVTESLKVQDTIGICAPHVSQYLGLKLVKNRRTIIPKFVDLMASNYLLATDLLQEVSWMNSSPSAGAYYLFPQQTTKKATLSLVRELILDYGVYIVPGEGFGQSWQDYCRISFANANEEQLKKAFSRLRSYS